MAFQNQAFMGSNFQMSPTPGMGLTPPPPGARTLFFYLNFVLLFTFSNIKSIAVMWMPKPSSLPGCPAGLEYLSMLDQIQVHQVASVMEAVTGWDTNNKYVLRNREGQQFLYAIEESDTFMRLCCGNRRRFMFHVVDNLGQEVMRVKRDFKCCAGCCWCAGCCRPCAHEVVVEAPPGNVIGTIKQKGSCWKPYYSVLDEQERKILRIEGPCCIADGVCCPCDQEFTLSLHDDERHIGKISKQYAGFAREAFTMADRFAITFPPDLSVKVKATLIGALLLIDFMFFEQPPNNNNRSSY